jgi:hypothetical protein
MYWHNSNSLNYLQFENLVDGLIEGAADSFNFNNNSFLPEDARTALNGFVDANVDSINISGTYIHCHSWGYHDNIIKFEDWLICTIIKNN